MKVAVVGSGISGLGAAWLLDRKHDVHLFEKRSRLGGHTHTVVHDLDGRGLPLDTGFIVYNEKTYPLLTRLVNELSVETQTIDMSFSVSCAEPDLEYASHGLDGFFATCDRVLRPGGRMALQTITMPDQVYDRYRGGDEWFVAHTLMRPRDAGSGN
jgi:predicted NAD/FAD-binding protein